jgi:hypothetical protein
MERTLCVKERVMLLGLLSNVQSNVLTLRMIDDVLKETAFSEEEIKENNMTVLPNGSMNWTDGSKSKDIKIPELIEKLIEKKLKELDAQEKISVDHMRLYEMFVEKKWDYPTVEPQTENNE